MNKEINKKIDDALFNFHLEADKDTVGEFLQENVQNMNEYEKKKKQMIFLAKATVAKKRNDYLLSLVAKFQDGIQNNIEKPVAILKQLLQCNSPLALYRNLDTLSKEDIIELIKDKNLIELLEQLDGGDQGK